MPKPASAQFVHVLCTCMQTCMDTPCTIELHANTAVEVGVPKLGNCLEMYTCAQASVQLVHGMYTNLDTPCTLKLLLGHPLYTGAVYMLAHRLGHVYISKQFPSLGTPTFTAV